MSDNTVNFSNNTTQLDHSGIKEALNSDNKIWWNTRAGYIIKTVYNPEHRSFNEHNHPFNINPQGHPIKFGTNEVDFNSS